ncbi:hypothetical protein CASFOL_026171 [Castilleja foliolosa]|uniref:Uncharacterized protein n=1 Tax=Castilleja foliolosa TaxID=1961234 RepID=A0ABD3CKQ2_9LAMI
MFINEAFRDGANSGGDSGDIPDNTSIGGSPMGSFGGFPDTTSAGGSAVRGFGGLNDTVSRGGSPLGSFGGASHSTSVGAIRRGGGAINIPTRSLSVRGAVLWYESSKGTSFKFSQSAPPNSQD